MRYDKEKNTVKFDNNAERIEYEAVKEFYKLGIEMTYALIFAFILIIIHMVIKHFVR